MFTLMNTKQRHNTFCARPGCGIAKASHETCAVACRNYIDPTSSAGVAIRKAAKAARLRLCTPLPETEEETVEIDPPSDAELLADWVRTGEML